MLKNKIFNLLFIVILVISFEGLKAQTRTVGVIINDSANTYKGYTLFAPKHYTSTYLINNQGRLIHKWSNSQYAPGQSVYITPNGHLLRACMIQGQLGTGGGEGGRVEEYTWGDTLIWQFTYSTTNYISHHDIKRLPNGNIIMLAVEKKTLAQIYAAGFNPAKLNPEIISRGYMLPDYVIEVQPIYPVGGNIVWEWHVWDHLIQDFDSTKQNFGDVANHPELIDCDGDGRQLPAFWNHMNSITYNARFDQILMSVRGNSEA
ncbi:MAG: aryl-sulfate sulfotransferase, partial [Paludibacter sp.]